MRLGKRQADTLDLNPPNLGACDCQVPLEILEAALEIVSGSDVIGVERWRLEEALRVALCANHRLRRDEVSCELP